MGAFGSAWNTLKALPDQREITHPGQITPSPYKGPEQYDDVDMGTLHPGALSAMRRLQGEGPLDTRSYRGGAEEEPGKLIGTATERQRTRSGANPADTGQFFNPDTGQIEPINKAWSVLKLDRSHFNRLEIDDDDELSYEPTEEYPGQHRDEPVKNPMHEAAMDERFEEEEAEGVPEISRSPRSLPTRTLDLSTPKNPFQKSWNTLKARTERAYSPMHGEGAPTAEQRAIDRSVAMKPDNLQTMTQLAGMPQDISSATGNMPRQTERANVMRDENRNITAEKEGLDMGVSEAPMSEEEDYVKYLLDRRKGENEARFRESAGSEGSPAGRNIGGLSSRVAL